jgi:hypothetical protein
LIKRPTPTRLGHDQKDPLRFIHDPKSIFKPANSSANFFHRMSVAVGGVPVDSAPTTLITDSRSPRHHSRTNIPGELSR